MAIVDRKEQTRISHQHSKGIIRRQVIEDVGRERQAILAQVVQILWLSVIALEALLSARVVLKLIAANPDVPFASFIYHITGWFLGPFKGLVVSPSANGMVFEVSTIIAMAAYVLAGWLLIRLIWLAFKPSSRRHVKAYEEIN